MAAPAAVSDSTSGQQRIASRLRLSNDCRWLVSCATMARNSPGVHAESTRPATSSRGRRSPTMATRGKRVSTAVAWTALPSTASGRAPAEQVRTNLRVSRAARQARARAKTTSAAPAAASAASETPTASSWPRGSKRWNAGSTNAATTTRLTRAGSSRAASSSRARTTGRSRSVAAPAARHASAIAVDAVVLATAKAAKPTTRASAQKVIASSPAASRAPAAPARRAAPRPGR